MDKYNANAIKELKEFFIDTLKDYEGKPILLKEMDPKLLKEIIFEHVSPEAVKALMLEVVNSLSSSKTNALPEYNIVGHYYCGNTWENLKRKIDLSNVSFDNVDVELVDFTGTKGVKLNPQKVYDKSLYGAKLNGVEIIGNIDGVETHLTDFSGAKLKEMSSISEIDDIKKYVKSFVSNSK